MVGLMRPAPDGWPAAVGAVDYPASADDSLQPMLLWAAQSTQPRPLLVGLHTWSAGYEQAGGETVYARWCMARDWHFIHPHFRGPNWTPDACGSERAVQDILDAVEYMQAQYAVDAECIYLIGASGGGYASLLMAGRAPDIWAGVSAWVPINDLHRWWRECRGTRAYAEHIESVVGGRPDDDDEAARQCVIRSACTYLAAARDVPLDINAGVRDGHQGSVPFSHSLYAFNCVAAPEDRLNEQQIEAFYATQMLPEGFVPAEADALYGDKEPIFRATSGNARVTIFNGAHEIVHAPALNWLAHQRRGRRAQWALDDVLPLHTGEGESASGR